MYTDEGETGINIRSISVIRVQMKKRDIRAIRVIRGQTRAGCDDDVTQM